MFHAAQRGGAVGPISPILKNRNLTRGISRGESWREEPEPIFGAGGIGWSRIVGTQPPLKYASPKIFGGSNIEGRGAKASALKTSLEIASTTSVRGYGAPRMGRSWRPRLGKAKDLEEMSGA